MGNFYLDKYSFFQPQITAEIDESTKAIVVIPCYNEPNLIASLQALYDCELSAAVEVIVVINCAENALIEIKNQNEKTLIEARKWSEKQNSNFISYHFIFVNDLPKKHAGVGLARKIGMDEAVARFHSINHDGIIVMFDADSLCDANYLSEIIKHFAENPKTPGCSIYFEHPLKGNEYEPEIYVGITKYELFLRYYLKGLRVANLPYAFYTVGSSMAVRSNAYQKQGGMNKRKAGEDFYFIQKIIELGHYTELNSTRVIPSSRTSNRVPFGTGKAINDWVKQSTEEYLTYNPQTFYDLRGFTKGVESLFESDNWEQYCSACLKEYLIQNNFSEALLGIRKNSANQQSFVKRFYTWLNAFRVLKFVHFARDNYYEQIMVERAAALLLKLDDTEASKLLSLYRNNSLD
ncbi:MAG: glycosyltransferase family 2 protein [Flavobacteriales bacterium]|nr:glycosyltransferase family 2 protein [Flavobacteriales bacterium]